MKEQVEFGFSSLMREIPAVAKVMTLGLFLVSIFVISDFSRLLSEPGPLVAGEDLYIHIALLVLVPGSFLAMLAISFGYAYYQLCKQSGRKPFWK
jgi:hypothetical protein